MNAQDFWESVRKPSRAPAPGAAMAATSAPALAAKPPGRVPVPVTDANSAMPDDDPEKLVAELREAARSAGVQRDDPMMPLLTAFAQFIRFVGSRTTSTDRNMSAAAGRITEALAAARTLADAETARFKVCIEATQAETIHDISNAIARSADRALARRIAVFDRNTALLAAGLLFAVAGGCLGGGYWWGSTDTAAAIHQTEWKLQAAFANGSKGASIWAALMGWNDINQALHACQDLPQQTGVFKNRRACYVPLWVENPPPVLPDQIQIEAGENAGR